MSDSSFLQVAAQMNNGEIMHSKKISDKKNLEKEIS